MKRLRKKERKKERKNEKKILKRLVVKEFRIIGRLKSFEAMN